MKKHKFTVVLACSFALLVALGSAPLVWAEPINMDPSVTSGTIVVDGTAIDFRKEGAALPLPRSDYEWWYGCSPTSAGMMMGYYDLHGYGGLYYDILVLGGPAETETYPPAPPATGSNALANNAIASQGHIADFYHTPPGYGGSGDDTGPSHNFNCLADYMGTNQDACGNSNGGTTFWNFTDGSPFFEADAVTYGVTNTSGMYGIGEYVNYAATFNPATNYDPAVLYNQYVDALGLAYGFTFAQYRAEIDAGRPVLIHTENHTMLGYGYDGSNVLLYDTWNQGNPPNADHTMPWGGTYGGVSHLGVTCLTLRGGSQETVDIPEPATLVMLCTVLGGLAVVGYVRRRRP